MARIATFDDWIDLFYVWQEALDLDPAKFRDYRFEAKFQDVPHREVIFGSYRGRQAWDRVTQIPGQGNQDSLLRLITVQGDTEFASVEQQRHLVHTAPSPEDLWALVKINREEMRHGWQMCHLLVTHFGSGGKIEAQKMLERTADKNSRLLQAFNLPCDHWLDLFCYQEFMDRDGKYQLLTLSHSGFIPLAQSTKYMLREEAFHLQTGHLGLQRTVKKGKIPVSLIQKSINKWYPACLDLFGQDESTSAYWFYLSGIKARPHEDRESELADLEHLNEHVRQDYVNECQRLMDDLNKYVAKGEPKLSLPNDRFNRSIGKYADQSYSIDGRPLSQEEYAKHLSQVLPGPEDKKILETIFQEGDWLEPMPAKLAAEAQRKA